MSDYYEDRNKSKGDWKFFAGVIVGMVIVLVGWSLAHAESAIVSFNDAEHLVALTDSVVGVCEVVDDTVWGQIFLEQANYSIDGTRLNVVRPGVVYYDGLSGMEGAYQYLIATQTITCRELVCMTVVRPIQHVYEAWSDHSYWCKGQALIFYRRVTQ